MVGQLLEGISALTSSWRKAGKYSRRRVESGRSLTPSHRGIAQSGHNAILLVQDNESSSTTESQKSTTEKNVYKLAYRQ